MENKKNKIYTSTLVIFWILVALFFLVTITEFFALDYLEKMPPHLFNILIFSVYTSLGIALIVLASKGKFTKISKAFFILTGVSLAGSFLNYILGNFVFTEFLKFEQSPVIFIVAFLVGVIGSIVLIARKKVKLY